MANKKKYSYEDYQKFLKDKGSAKEEKSKFSRFLSKRTPIQLSILLVGSIVTVVYFLYLFVSILTSSAAIWLFVMLFIVNLISCMWLFNKIGVAACIIILLGVLVRYGPLPLLALIYTTAFVWMYFSVRPTPIDFAITKGVQGSVAMMVYQTLWVVIMSPVVSHFGTAYVLNHLVFVYMLGTVVYVILMMIFLPLITREPIPTVLMNGMVMTAVEYAQVIYIAPWFFAYIMSV